MRSILLLELHCVSLVQAPFSKFNIVLTIYTFCQQRKKNGNDNEIQDSTPMYIPWATYCDENGDDVDNKAMMQGRIKDFS